MVGSVLRRLAVGIAAGIVLGCVSLTVAQETAAQENAADKQEAPAAKSEKAAEKHEAPASEKAAASEKTAEKHEEPSTAKAGDHHAAEPASTAAHDSHGSSGSGHGGGHHDPHDLSHQNATRAIEDPSQWKSDLAIASLIVFLCLLALLSKFAWRPVMNGLEARERAIAANIDEAKRSADRAAEQLHQYELKLAAAAEEARGIVDQARRDAESAKERILAEAQAVAQRERQRAVDDINTAKNVALQEMTQKSVDLAVSLAGKLIRKQLRPEDHSQLIREMVEQFPSKN